MAKKKEEERTPQQLLWELTLAGKAIWERRVEAEQNHLSKLSEYYLRKAELTVNDSIMNLSSRDKREAEVKLILDQEGLERDRAEVEAALRMAEREWELFVELSKNCRALVYSEKDVSNFEGKEE